MKSVKNENAIEVIDVTKNFKIYYDKASTLKEKAFFGSEIRVKFLLL